MGGYLAGEAADVATAIAKEKAFEDTTVNILGTAAGALTGSIGSVVLTAGLKGLFSLIKD